MLEDGVTLIEAVLVAVLFLAFAAPGVLLLIVGAIASIPLAIAARIAGLVERDSKGRPSSGEGE